MPFGANALAPRSQPGVPPNQLGPLAPAEGGTAQAIAQVWRAHGWTNAAIAGGLANGFAESGLDPDGPPGAEGERYAFQFHPKSHLGPYRDFVRERKGDPADIRLQAEYVANWVDKHMPGYGQIADPHAATDTFMTGFEAPSNPVPGKRYHYLSRVPDLGQEAAPDYRAALYPQLYGSAAGIPGLAGGPSGPAYMPAQVQTAPELTSWGGAAGIPGLPGSPSGPAYRPVSPPPPLPTLQHPNVYGGAPGVPGLPGTQAGVDPPPPSQMGGAGGPSDQHIGDRALNPAQMPEISRSAQMFGILAALAAGYRPIRINYDPRAIYEQAIQPAVYPRSAFGLTGPPVAPTIQRTVSAPSPGQVEPNPFRRFLQYY